MSHANAFTLKGTLFHCTMLFFITGLCVGLNAQTYTILYQFRAGNDGTAPSAGVTLDTKRVALYGTTSADGKFASGTVFKFNKNGESVLYNFTGSGSDGEFPLSPVLLDSSGNLYGTTPEGGNYNDCGSLGCGIVFKIDQSGNETILHGFTSTPDGAVPQGSLAIDPTGNLYGATGAGGTVGEGIIFEVSQSGTETILHSFGCSQTDGCAPAGGVVRDVAGDLFGTTQAGGQYFGGTVFELSASGIESTLYNFGTNPQDGSNPVAGLSLDASGNLYGMARAGGTYNLGTVFKITPQGTETILHNFGFAPDGNSPNLPTGVILDPAGNVYGVTSSGGAFDLGMVYEIDTAGNEIILHNFSGSDGKVPYGNLARDPQGNLYGTTSQGGAYGGGVLFRIRP